MRVNLLADIFSANWELWQDIVVIILIILVGGLVFYGIAFLLVNNGRMEESGTRMAKRVKWVDKQLKTERQELENERIRCRQDLEKSRNELKEQEEAAVRAETEARLMREQLAKKKQELKELLSNLETTEKELTEYLKREGTIFSTDVIVNCVTDNAVNQSQLTMDPAFNDCKIPKDETFNYTVEDIKNYIQKKHNVSFTDNKIFIYKFDNANGISRTVAMLQVFKNGKFKISFKCGPNYGTKLCTRLSDTVKKSTYPKKLLWFIVDNSKSPCSLELIKLLIDISYRIAKVGY